MEFHFDNNFTDSSGNGIFVFGTNISRFVTPGKFGTHARAINYPSATNEVHTFGT